MFIILRIIAARAEKWVPLPLAKLSDHYALAVKERFYRANATGNPGHFVRGVGVSSARDIKALHDANIQAEKDGLKGLDFAYFGGYEFSGHCGNADFGIQPVLKIMRAAAEVREGEMAALFDIFEQTKTMRARIPVVVDGETLDNDSYRAIEIGRAAVRYGLNLHIEDQKGNDGFNIFGKGRGCGNYEGLDPTKIAPKNLVFGETHQNSLAAYEHGVQMEMSYDPAIIALMMLPVPALLAILRTELPYLSAHFKTYIDAIEANPDNHSAKEMLLRKLFAPMRIARFDDLRGEFPDGSEGSMHTAAISAAQIQAQGLADVFWVEMSLQTAEDWQKQVPTVVARFRQEGATLPIMTNLSPNAFVYTKATKAFGVRTFLEAGLRTAVEAAVRARGGNDYLVTATLAHLDAALSPKMHPISESFLTESGISGGFSTFGPAQAQEFANLDFLHAWTHVYGDYFSALHASQAEIAASKSAKAGLFSPLSQNSRTRPWEAMRALVAGRRAGKL